MATHSSTLAWRIPWMGGPGGLQSTRSQSDTTERLHFLSFYSSFWRRKWQPTPVFLPGESHGWRGLVGYSPWGCKESDMTKQVTHTQRDISASQEKPLSCMVMMFLGVTNWYLSSGQRGRWSRLPNSLQDTGQHLAENYSVVCITERLRSPESPGLTCCSDPEGSLSPCRNL